MDKEVTKQAAKPSYEQLEQGYFSILEEAKKIQSEANKKIQELQLFNTFKRLEFLFKVVEHPELFSAEFVNSVVNEIEEVLTLPEDNKEEGKDEQGDK